jgi:hypothetical protein
MDHFEEEFFPNSKVIHLEFDLLSDEWIQLEQEIKQNEWTSGEGIRFFIAAGIRAIHDIDQKNLIEGNSNKKGDILDEALKERLLLESKYAVMRYRAYQYMQTAKILDMKYKSALSQIRNHRKINKTE